METTRSAMKFMTIIFIWGVILSQTDFVCLFVCRPPMLGMSKSADLALGICKYIKHDDGDDDDK